MTAQLVTARAAVRLELAYLESLPPDAPPPGEMPEIDDPAIGYSGPAPCGMQARYLRSRSEC